MNWSANSYTPNLPDDHTTTLRPTPGGPRVLLGQYRSTARRSTYDTISGLRYDSYGVEIELDFSGSMLCA